MEPLEILAGTVLALILKEASKESGKALGKSASELISQLRQILWEKIIKKDKLPSAMEPEVLEGEILEVLQEDSSLAEQAQLVINIIQPDETANQVIVEYAKAKNITLERVKQVRINSGSKIKQALISNADVEGDIKISDATQEG